MCNLQSVEIESEGVGTDQLFILKAFPPDGPLAIEGVGIDRYLCSVFDSSESSSNISYLQQNTTPSVQAMTTE